MGYILFGKLRLKGLASFRGVCVRRIVRDGVFYARSRTQKGANLPEFFSIVNYVDCSLLVCCVGGVGKARRKDGRDFGIEVVVTITVAGEKGMRRTKDKEEENL